MEKRVLLFASLVTSIFVACNVNNNLKNGDVPNPTLPHDSISGNTIIIPSIDYLKYPPIDTIIPFPVDSLVD